jgi:hypothetical protein
MTRTQLAARSLGDAHALDTGQPAATLVLAVWRKKGLDERDQFGRGHKETPDEKCRAAHQRVFRLTLRATICGGFDLKPRRSEMRCYGTKLHFTAQ